MSYKCKKKKKEVPLIKCMCVFPRFVPLGLMDWLVKTGCENVMELDWWEENCVPGHDDVTFVCTPSQHWSKRTALDDNKVIIHYYWVDITFIMYELNHYKSTGKWDITYTLEYKSNSWGIFYFELKAYLAHKHNSLSLSLSLYGAAGPSWVRTIDSSSLVIPATALPFRRSGGASDHLTLQQSPSEPTCPGSVHNVYTQYPLY